MDSVYIRASESVLVNNHEVLLKDIITIQASDPKLIQQVGNIHVYTFKKDTPAEIIISIMTIINLILKHYPNLEIDNIGEIDVIVKFEPKSKQERLKEIFFTIFLCLVAFIGGGYAIMAYNTDIGAKELFNYLSMLFLGDPKKGTFCLSITYAIGLSTGLIIFFNHLGNKKLTKEPTPLEVQMRLYEQDVYTTMVKDGARRNKNL